MAIKHNIKKLVKRVLLPNEAVPQNRQEERDPNMSSSEYWTKHNVTHHFDFKSREESLKFLKWRSSQYLFYEELMPCSGFDGKVVLDYGCGPGHDLVGFVEESNATKIIAMDVSSSSLKESENRIKLHKKEATNIEFMLIKENEKIPLADNSVDYIHSSGVIHHTPNPVEILKEFHRILRPGGIIRIMVYNYNSIFVHLFVPYFIQIVKKTYSDLPLHEAFKRKTDGPNCPISNYYTPAEFLKLGAESSLKGKFLGSAMFANEMHVLPQRYSAILDMNLAEEHRLFLAGLTFDKYLRPLHKGDVAGMDAVFEFTK